MKYIRDIIPIDLSEDRTILQRHRSSFEMLSINIGWTGADNTDGTFDLYVGTWDAENPTSLKNLSQLGSQITLSTANSNLTANITNYAGVYDCVYIVYTANSNTEGTANLVINKGS